MRRVIPAVILPVSALTLLSGCAGTDESSAPAEATGDTPTATSGTARAAGDRLTATLLDAEGAEVGTVEFSKVREGTQVSVEVTDLPPGFHGFHVHAVGVCDPDSASPSDPSMTGDFLSAGGHLGADTAQHGHHAGDLPLLRVTEAGTGSLSAVTDAFTLADLLDEDGSAVMVHANADNYANIPEVYAPEGPNPTTLATGDAGGRIACGRVEE
jgi:Cu-Zn family superoxide dismutase